MKRLLSAQGILGLEMGVLDKGPYQVAKWRYETVAASFSDLLKYRDLSCHVRFDWFANTKEPETVRKAFMAMHNDEWWTFSLRLRAKCSIPPNARAIGVWSVSVPSTKHNAWRLATNPFTLRVGGIRGAFQKARSSFLISSRGDGNAICN